jgi:hypothetical protein
MNAVRLLYSRSLAGKTSPTRNSPLTNHYSPFSAAPPPRHPPARISLFTFQSSLFTIHFSLFSAPSFDPDSDPDFDCPVFAFHSCSLAGKTSAAPAFTFHFSLFSSAAFLLTQNCRTP